MNLPWSIRMYWPNFWQPTVHVQQNIFEKSLKEVGSSHRYDSFGTFCVQIGHFLEAQWVFEKCLKTVKLLFSKENVVFFEIFRKFKVSLRLEYFLNLDAKGAKRIVKMWATNLLRAYSKYFVVHNLSAVRNYFSTYVWRKVDSCFCWAVYVQYTVSKSHLYVQYILYTYGC